MLNFVIFDIIIRRKKNLMTLWPIKNAGTDKIFRMQQIPETGNATRMSLLAQ